MNIYSASCDLIHEKFDGLRYRGAQSYFTWSDLTWPAQSATPSIFANTSPARLQRHSLTAHLASVMTPRITSTGHRPQEMRCTCISRRRKTGLTRCQEVAAPRCHNRVTSFCISAQRTYEATVLTIYKKRHQAHLSCDLSDMPAAVHRLCPSSRVPAGQA
jgi:hypothetical protein